MAKYWSNRALRGAIRLSVDAVALRHIESNNYTTKVLESKRQIQPGKIFIGAEIIVEERRG